ncbi:MAG: cupin domain-containing protein [Pseudomonadota bacterium]
MDGVEHRIGPDEAIEVPPGAPHQAMNREGAPLHFLVISSPSTRDDREPAP